MVGGVCALPLGVVGGKGFGIKRLMSSSHLPPVGLLIAPTQLEQGLGMFLS